MAEKTDHPGETSHYDAYSAFARTLRAWLVAYGIGAPVLFFSRDKVADSLASSGKGRTIVIFFLVGVCLQIASALLYKTTEWYLYCGEVEKSFRKRWRYRVALFFSNQYWLDMVIDIGTITTFVWATYKTLLVVAH